MKMNQLPGNRTRREIESRQGNALGAAALIQAKKDRGMNYDGNKDRKRLMEEIHKGIVGWM